MKEYKGFVALWLAIGMLFMFSMFVPITYIVIRECLKHNFGMDFITVFLLVMCFFSFLISPPLFFMGVARISLSQKGIEKKLLGIRVKNYKWEEIKDIYVIETGVGVRWIFFSKKHLGNKGINRCWLQTKTTSMTIGNERKWQQIKQDVLTGLQIRETKEKSWF